MDKEGGLISNSLAIIPARSGSLGIPHKNIKTFIDKPLLAHTIQHAKNSGLFQDIIVSTNSQQYADIAIQYGASVPFLRPHHLAAADIPTSEVTLHILRQLQKQHIHYDYCAILPPTSPLRTIQDLQDSYTLLLDTHADVIISVSKTSHQFEWSNTLDDSMSLKHFISKEFRNKPRQQLPIRYRIHGAVFWTRISAYLLNQDPYDMNSIAYIMPEERSIDIDTLQDFYLAEILYTQNHTH